MENKFILLGDQFDSDSIKKIEIPYMTEKEMIEKFHQRSIPVRIVKYNGKTHYITCILKSYEEIDG